MAYSFGKQFNLTIWSRGRHIEPRPRVAARGHRIRSRSGTLGTRTTEGGIHLVLRTMGGVQPLPVGHVVRDVTRCIGGRHRRVSTERTERGARRRTQQRHLRRGTRPSLDAATPDGHSILPPGGGRHLQVHLLGYRGGHSLEDATRWLSDRGEVSIRRHFWLVLEALISVYSWVVCNASLNLDLEVKKVLLNKMTTKLCRFACLRGTR